MKQFTVKMACVFGEEKTSRNCKVYRDLTNELQEEELV